MGLFFVFCFFAIDFCGETSCLCAVNCTNCKCNATDLGCSFAHKKKINKMPVLSLNSSHCVFVAFKISFQTSSFLMNAVVLLLVDS